MHGWKQTGLPLAVAIEFGYLHRTLGDPKLKEFGNGCRSVALRMIVCVDVDQNSGVMIW
jgi:hypothetical protein